MTILCVVILRMITYHVSLLLCLQFLVQFAQARRSMMVRIRRHRRARKKLRAHPLCGWWLLGCHFAGTWYGGVVELEVHHDSGTTTTGLWRWAIAGKRAAGGLWITTLV